MTDERKLGFEVDATISNEEKQIGSDMKEETTADKFLDNIFGKQTEEFMSNVETKFNSVHNDIHEVKNNISSVENKVHIVNQDLNEVQIGMQSVQERIGAVEKTSSELNEVVVVPEEDDVTVEETAWKNFF